MRKSIVTVLAAALAGLTAFPVAAEEASLSVSYADLDLTKPAGTQVLEARVDKALDKVCANPDLRELKAAKEFEACKAEGRDAAMEQLSLRNPFDGIALASAF